MIWNGSLFLLTKASCLTCRDSPFPNLICFVPCEPALYIAAQMCNSALSSILFYDQEVKCTFCLFHRSGSCVHTLGNFNHEHPAQWRKSSLRGIDRHLSTVSETGPSPRTFCFPTLDNTRLARLERENVWRYGGETAAAKHGLASSERFLFWHLHCWCKQIQIDIITWMMENFLSKNGNWNKFDWWKNKNPMNHCLGIFQRIDTISIMAAVEYFWSSVSGPAGCVSLSFFV